MEYLFVTWDHNFQDEPKEFYMELDEKRSQKKVLEIFEDGNIAYATTTEEFNTFLAKETYPSVEEVNSTDEFRATIITKEDFERVWKNRDKQI